MRTWPAYRVGRRYYWNSNGSGPQGRPWIVMVLVTVAFGAVVFGAIPIVMVQGELAYRNMLQAFAEVESDIVPLEVSHDGDIVHFQSANVSASSADPSFGVRLPGALQLRRNTEYCQWEETAVTAKDDENRTYTEYHYVKTWRSRRIFSATFDQPGAHHNPQRDPLPSETFPAHSAMADLGTGGAASIAQDVLARTRAPWRAVDWTLGAQPKKYWWWPFEDRTRYESIADLAGVDRSYAASSHNFAYVGQGGYFFSPYETSMAESMFKYFVQYVEGSLFDWQLGDLMPSCTAGDIRVYFSVQDPSTVSVVGGVRGSEPSPGGGRLYSIGLFRTLKDYDVGMLHAGRASAHDMMAKEARRQAWQCWFFRLLLLLPTGFTAAGVDASPRAPAVAVGLWSLVVAVVWLAVWGARLHVLGPLALAAVAFAFRSGKGLAAGPADKCS
eukprot:CAMPEP_0204564780 /NCGR_PEP_ID=MMETSP0661-20131031/35091_1 /ASSEMBLY_ACC=CAM_ASM_000606 /TAXON_ID=109239 /ORGANISM="Alexandrium margalefi, Strain AMGDE01CS-322" /LENGTH=441 /DNA_ID=CAMNT_0051572461 /DNA_START=69 /DNA_END=1394 /DNA_ORIENTATION=-